MLMVVSRVDKGMEDEALQMNPPFS
jgi:hypothetical protein